MTKQKLTLYYVEGGDTLFRIARRFNTTEQEIVRFNRPWFMRLSPGLKLWVPDNRIGTQTSSDVDVERDSEAVPEASEVEAAGLENSDISLAEGEREQE